MHFSARGIGALSLHGALARAFFHTVYCAVKWFFRPAPPAAVVSRWLLLAGLTGAAAPVARAEPVVL